MTCRMKGHAFFYNLNCQIFLVSLDPTLLGHLKQDKFLVLLAVSGFYGFGRIPRSQHSNGYKLLTVQPSYTLVELWGETYINCFKMHHIIKVNSESTGT